MARATPNDPKLSDGGGWRSTGWWVCWGVLACAVTAVAVRCSAWLGDIGEVNERVQSSKEQHLIALFDVGNFETGNGVGQFVKACDWSEVIANSSALASKGMNRLGKMSADSPGVVNLAAPLGQEHSKYPLAGLTVSPLREPMIDEPASSGRSEAKESNLRRVELHELLTLVLLSFVFGAAVYSHGRKSERVAGGRTLNVA